MQHLPGHMGAHFLVTWADSDSVLEPVTSLCISAEYWHAQEAKNRASVVCGLVVTLVCPLL